MVILVDIGNSNIVLAQYDNKINKIYRFNTDRDKATNEYMKLFKDILDNADEMIISSVVPELNRVFKTICEEKNIDVTFVGPGVKTGVKIKTDNPKELGTDIVCDAAGAFANYTDSAIIVDMGTASTVTYIDNKVIKGVSICAGLITQKDALVGKASQLAQFEFITPSKAIGTNTIDALNSGLLYGHAYMLSGIINQIKKENNNDVKVIVTGGASRYMKDLLPTDYIFDDSLLIKGLLAIYLKNNKQA